MNFCLSLLVTTYVIIILDPFVIISTIYGYSILLSAPYLELPGEIPYSDFSLYFPRGKGLPTYFGWLTGKLIL